MRSSDWAPWAAAVVALTVALVAPAAGADDVTPQELKVVMDRLTGEIRAAQNADGSWVSPQYARWTLGNSALCVLALSEAGAPADDPALNRGVQYLLKADAGSVYESALKIAALESVGGGLHAAAIAREARYLLAAQNESGGWGYSRLQPRADNSNSQFAVLGLRSAARSGFNVPADVWKRAWEYYALGQKADGGWSYIQQAGASYGSMTVAGIASLHICALHIHLGRGRCGDYVDDTRMQAGLTWLADNFQVAANPGNASFRFYYLYGLERAGVISARRYMGAHDWYLEGVRHLVRNPGAIGAGTEPMEWPLIQKCFALLFLAKGNTPVLMHKAQWSGEWNPYHYDAELLVDHVAELFGQRLSWQIVPLASPPGHLAAAPILYVSGRGELHWTPLEVQRFKEFLEADGFVLVEANAADQAFDRSFRRLIAEQFPEQRLSALSRDHPVYSAHYELPAADRIPLEGLEGTCSTWLIYSPTGLSCSWDVGEEQQPTFKLGVNIIAYATGLQKLPGKLESRQKQLQAAAQGKPAVFQGAFVVGQYVPEGRWQPFRDVWARILGKVHEEVGLGLFSEPVKMDIERDDLFQAHLLDITGTGELRLSAAAQEKLRRYAERGGFIAAPSHTVQADVPPENVVAMIDAVKGWRL